MSARTTSGISAGLALLPVRLFLGVTFVYAGYQKLSDPGFLTPGSATYIGTQLHAFATSPGPPWPGPVTKTTSIARWMIARFRCA